MVTYVTAFLLRDTSKHSVDEYKKHFELLVDTGVHIVLYLDRRLLWAFPKHVYIIPTSLEELPIYQRVPVDAQLPSIRSPTDTREYMTIINSKTEFVLRASHLDPFSTEWFAWIDFGIGHVFRTPETTLRRIRDLVPPTEPCMRTAGIWRHIPESVFDAVCWRYAGGFFLVHTTVIPSVHEAVLASIQRNLPKFAWEVNIWADVERNGVDLGWFPADHNDSIIPSSETLRVQDLNQLHSE